MKELSIDITCEERGYHVWKIELLLGIKIGEIICKALNFKLWRIEVLRVKDFPLRIEHNVVLWNGPAAHVRLGCEGFQG